jgi:hypothetical protein
VGHFDCGGRAGLEMGRGGAHIGVMALNFIKLALLAGLGMLTLGVIPDSRRGAMVAVATSIAAALILHFVAP